MVAAGVVVSTVRGEQRYHRGLCVDHRRTVLWCSIKASTPKEDIA